MNLREAIAAIYCGKKVALPELGGYWFKDNQGRISVMTFDNQVTNTPWFGEFANREDFVIVGERYDQALRPDCGCENLQRAKILFADLDGTLIETKSGETFPKDKYDWRLRKNITSAIREYRPTHLFIVSNQGGIEKGFISQEDFAQKMQEIVRDLRISTLVETVNFTYCASNDKENINRKPNIGMIERTITEFFGKDCQWYKRCSLMIGDASGKEGQFSDSDKKCAENAGIEYLDVEEFIDKYIPKEFSNYPDIASESFPEGYRTENDCQGSDPEK